MSEPKFKVGDKVKIANPRLYRELLKDCTYEIKTVYAFDKVFETEYLLKDYNNLVFESELEKVEEEMKKEFTLDDLRNGDVVKHKNGQVAIFVDLRGVGSFVLKNGYRHRAQYNNDLTANEEDWDIVAIRRPESPYQCQYCAIDKGYGALVYERKEIEEMTLEEICKALGKEIKIVKEKK